MHIHIKKSISIPHIFEILWKSTSFKYLSTLKYYLKVGMPWSSINHPFHETESIYCFCGCILIWKQASPRLSLWNVILKHFTIKALTLACFGITLIKNYIGMWLLCIYIHVQKITLQLKLFLSYWSFNDLQILLVKTESGAFLSWP